VVQWITRTLLWEVLGAVVLGAAIGAVSGRAERLAHSRQFAEETSVFTVAVALTFAVLGFVTLLGSDGILAVFVAGAAYNWQADPSDEVEAQRIEEVFDRLFTLPVFVFFGMAIPWAEWAALGWAGVSLVVGILLLRRLPRVLGAAVGYRTHRPARRRPVRRLVRPHRRRRRLLRDAGRPRDGVRTAVGRGEPRRRRFPAGSRPHPRRPLTYWYGRQEEADPSA